MATSPRTRTPRPRRFSDLGFLPDLERRYVATGVRALHAANSHHWPHSEGARGRLLVTPAPPDVHQRHAQRLPIALTAYCVARSTEGLPMLSPSGIT